jgi:hypothetical protein
VNASGFNRALINGEIQGALRTLGIARSHLVQATKISTPAFGIDPADAQPFFAALDDVNHAIEQLSPKPQPTPVIEIENTPGHNEQSQNS